MQDNNYKGQNLRGHSFKNKDLTAGDFTDCDLRGVDFSGCDLLNVKFCNAKMGHTKKTGLAILLFKLLLGFVGGFIVTIGNFFIWSIARDILRSFEIDSTINRPMGSVSIDNIIFIH